jgi:ADP-heptose:LPS heptosyltransferase
MPLLSEMRPKSFAIFRALMLGDMLCAVPAFRALRTAFEDARITLIGLPWARSFAARFDRYFDEFIEFPGFPGLPEREVALHLLPSFLDRVQRQRFDCVLQMHGSGSIVNRLVTLFGARRTAGFRRESDYCPDPDTFFGYPDDEPEVRRQLRLMSLLGVPLQGEDIDFPITPDDEQSLAAILDGKSLAAGEYVCIHPGARFASRRWNTEGFAHVANALAATGLRVVLTGSSSEADLTSAVARAMTAPSIDLAGQTSLGALGAVVRNSRLVITNDTGVSHIAAALNVPSVIIVLGSDPARWVGGLDWRGADVGQARRAWRTRSRRCFFFRQSLYVIAGGLTDARLRSSISKFATHHFPRPWER